MKKDDDYIIGYGTKYQPVYRELKKILSRRNIELKLMEGEFAYRHNRHVVIKYGDRVKTREIIKQYYKNHPHASSIVLDHYLKL
jgi:hypothetical protein